MNPFRRLVALARGDSKKLDQGTPISGIGSPEDRTFLPSGQPYKNEDLVNFLTEAEAGDTRRLHAFYDEMRARDLDLENESDKAEQAVAAGRISFLVYPPKLRTRVQGRSPRTGAHAVAEEVASYVRETITAPSVRLRTAIAHLVTADWKGLSAVQSTFRPLGRGNGYAISRLELVPSQRFLYAPSSPELLVQTTERTSDLVPLSSFPAGALVVRQVGLGTPSPARRGAYRRLLGLYVIRAYGPEVWFRFVEQFGAPFRVGKHPLNDQKTRRLLIESFRIAGNSGWAVVPEGAGIDFIATQTSGGSTVHEQLAEWSSRQIAKLISGATQATDIQKGSGSKASASVHADVALAKTDARAAGVALDLREQLLYPLVAATYGQEIADLYTPELVIKVTPPIDPLVFAEVLEKIVGAGGGDVIPKSAVAEAGVFEAPEPGEPTFEKPPAPMIPGLPGQKALPPGAEPDDDDLEDDDPDDQGDGGDAQDATRRHRAKVFSFGRRPLSPALDLAGLEERASRLAPGAGEEILAPYRRMIDDAEREGADLGQLLGRVLLRARIPADSPRLLDLLAAVQAEAMMRGFWRERRAR